MVEGGEEILNSHKSIAIITPYVFIKKCPDLSIKECNEINMAESRELYMKLFGEIVIKNTRKGQRLRLKKMSDIEKVLAANYYNLESKNDLGRLCDSLNVEGLLLSKFNVDAPTTPAQSAALAAVGTLLIPGFVSLGSTTNHINGRLVLYDKNSNTKFWSFSHDVSGSFLSRKEQLIKNFMSELAFHLPYF